jgi:DNA-binding transcriptional LysR family regulator
LEDRLGVKLLNRTTRVVQLTEIGVRYHQHVQAVIEGLQEANQTALSTHTELAGRIRMSGAGPFVENHVAPLLLQFAAQHPQITLEIDFETRLVDLVDQGFDFAIRYGVLAESGMIARKLSSRPLVCAASPDYLNRYPPPDHPRGLRQHSCLVINNDLWRFSGPDGKAGIELRVSGQVRANSVAVARDAAVRGLGIIYTPTSNVVSQIQDGTLVEILAEFVDTTRSHWIVYPERQHMPSRVRAAIDHLIAGLEQR